MINENLLLSLISVLLLIIAYFLRNLLIKFDAMNTTIQDLVIKTSVQSSSCTLTHKNINERFEHIEKKLNI